MTDDPIGSIEEPLGPNETKLDGSKLSVTRAIIDEMLNFLGEFSLVNIAFWNRPPSTLRPKVYLSILAVLTICGARSNFAASAGLEYAPTACMIVLCGAVLAVGIGLVFDSRYHASVREQAPDCYRLLIVGVIWTCIIIMTNNWFGQWSLQLSDLLDFSEDGFKERAVGAVLPATLISFGLIFGTSFAEPRFRQSWANERTRVLCWAVYILVSLLLLTLGMFVNVSLPKGS